MAKKYQWRSDAHHGHDLVHEIGALACKEHDDRVEQPNQTEWRNERDEPLVEEFSRNG